MPEDTPSSSYDREPAAVARGWQKLLSAVLASPCLGCSQLLPWRDAAMGLCASCRAATGGELPTSCATCGTPLRGVVPPGFRCGRCHNRPPPWQSFTFGWDYRPPLDAVIRACKYRRLPFLAEDVGVALWWRVGRQLPPVDVVVPIALPAWRRLQRGFNQAAAIAEVIARMAGGSMADGLRLPPLARPQARLSRGARRARRRFRWVGDGLAERRVLLVDDVSTTGATLRDACAALQSAGATTIHTLVALRTPAAGEV